LPGWTIATVCWSVYVLMRRLQSVQHAAARLIFNLKRSDHITDDALIIIGLHWLRIPERVRCEVAVLIDE
jgi:hypothetical protein